ncbi:MAG: serine/threonine-protein kinase [Solirubrobacterales bacterium]
MQEARLAPGARIGRYRLEGLLGRGGMASVWKATDERLGRTVAIKLLSETLAVDAGFMRRFEREAKIAAGLSHPNLVAVFDFDADGPRPYLVSEYVEGGTLAETLEGGTPVDAAAIAGELLGALEHIHSAGVVHRDVKPANVLLDTRGRSRLTDFGIAQSAGASRLTEAGKVIGTLSYMAPEVRAGKTADQRSDLYSCGVVIGECLTPADSPGLHDVVDRLTAKRPDDRPRSAAAAIELLGAATAGGTAATEPLSAAGEEKTLRMTGPTALAHTAVERVLAVRPGRGVLAAAALLAVIVAALASGIFSGGSENPTTPTKTGSQTGPTSGGAQPAPQATAPADPRTTPSPTTPSPTEPPTKEQQKALEEQQKAAEKSAGSCTPAPPGHGGKPPGHAKC